MSRLARWIREDSGAAQSVERTETVSEPLTKLLRCEESYQGDEIRPHLGMDFLRGLTASIGDTLWEKICYQGRALANDVRCIRREWRYWSRFHNFRRIK